MLSEISQADKDKYHMISSYVESNKQTDLICKIDRLIDGEQYDSCDGTLGVGGIEQKGTRTMDMDNSVVIVGSG